MAKDGPDKSGRLGKAPTARKTKTSAVVTRSEVARASSVSVVTKVRRPTKRGGETTLWQLFQDIFAENVKNARLDAGLTQSDVSAMIGLSQQYLSLIEAGQLNLTLKTMALLADVLDRDLVEMLKQRQRRAKH